ncbi:hypothetical protein ACIBHY_17175 [Nonomuraea sp. NPDC050547]|uniref:hypothetical protein n=1 Tax=Nonomuraea sp. NPDC050547 TaxID=3364368 RepID=UPI00378ED76A
MTDQYGADLERILRDMERRLQKLEAAQRVRPGLTIDFPRGAAVSQTDFDLSDAPATYTQAYAQAQSTGIAALFFDLKELLISLRGGNIIDT